MQTFNKSGPKLLKVLKWSFLATFSFYWVEIKVTGAAYCHTPSTVTVLCNAFPSFEVACLCWRVSMDRWGQGSITLEKQIFMINKHFIPRI